MPCAILTMTSSSRLYDVHHNLAWRDRGELAGPLVRGAEGDQPKVAYAGAVVHLPEAPSDPKSSGLDAVLGLNFTSTGRQHHGRSEAAAPFDRVQFQSDAMGVEGHLRATHTTGQLPWGNLTDVLVSGSNVRRLPQLPSSTTDEPATRSCTVRADDPRHRRLVSRSSRDASVRGIPNDSRGSEANREGRVSAI
jgi:hypothetical protein